MLDSQLPPHVPAIGRMSSKGQMVFPQSIRKALGYKKGMEFVFEPENDGSCHVRPAKTRSITELFGKLHVKGRKPMSARDIDKAIMAAVYELDQATIGSSKSRKKPKRKPR